MAVREDERTYEVTGTVARTAAKEGFSAISADEQPKLAAAARRFHAGLRGLRSWPRRGCIQQNVVPLLAASTTLAASVAAGDTAIDVASGAGFPAGPFRV